MPQARRCVQQALILRRCRDHAGESDFNVKRFLKDLIKYEDTQRELVNDLDTVMAVLSEAARVRDRPSPQTSARRQAEVVMPQESPPDSGYKIERSNFFFVGRVFSMVWYEPQGSTRRTTSTYLGAETVPNLGPSNVYTKVRRMVVVKADEGHCWCIAINTYGGQGCLKSGFRDHHVQQHAIAYKSGTTPTLLDGEPQMSKRAIAIDLIGNHSLHFASRLNFAKVHTVEHNSPVKNLGKVAPTSIEDFRRYFRDECGQ